MGVNVLYDPHAQMAVMYDTVSEYAFGPVFRDDTCPNRDAEEAALDFIDYMEPRDVRTLRDDEMEDAVLSWLAWREAALKAAIDAGAT